MPQLQKQVVLITCCKTTTPNSTIERDKEERMKNTFLIDVKDELHKPLFIGLQI